LQGATVGLLQTREFRHPFYWAAFTIIGDGY
jgi:CHAT domain-containing protein